MINPQICLSVRTDQKFFFRESKIFTIFFFYAHFFFFNFRFHILFCNKNYFRKIFFDFCFYYSALGASADSGGGVGERNEPPAGGLAIGAEGSVTSEFR